jgi:Zn-finger nucleic acid-binding protein
MCGSACPCSAIGKNKKKDKTKGSGDSSLAARNVQNAEKQGLAIIPTQNKGLCTLCDVNVWIVATSGLEIKWCKGCKNFRPWAAFGDKGLATKCLRCRDRQREKYAIQKEEKERTRMTSKSNKA